MPNYLLPCSCGEKTIVSTAEAGRSVRCSCGAAIEVPTLRGLRALEPADATATQRGKPAGRMEWDNRHRVGFVFALVALCAAATAAYLAIRLPPVDRPLTDQEAQQWIDTASPADVIAAYHELQRGIQPDVAVGATPTISREKLVRGIWIAGSLGLVALVAAAVVLRSAGKNSA